MKPVAGRPPDAANPGRTTADGLRSRVEDFLFKEAALLDEWRLDEWLGLLTEDARYVVPTTDLPDGDPQRDLVFIDDDMTRLRARVARLLGSHALREQPRSRTRRFVSNVRAEETDDGMVLVSANVWCTDFAPARVRPTWARSSIGCAGTATTSRSPTAAPCWTWKPSLGMAQ